MTDRTWKPLLRDQLARHWTNQLRDRLDGLTDDEYFWKPALHTHQQTRREAS